MISLVRQSFEAMDRFVGASQTHKQTINQKYRNGVNSMLTPLPYNKAYTILTQKKFTGVPLYYLIIVTVNAGACCVVILVSTYWFLMPFILLSWPYHIILIFNLSHHSNYAVRVVNSYVELWVIVYHYYHHSNYFYK